MTLQEYINKEVQRLYPTAHPRDGKRGIIEISKADFLAGENQDIYIAGFDAAIGLNLAVKFANWMHSVGEHKITYATFIAGFIHDNKRISTFAEAYTYWETNILKLE